MTAVNEHRAELPVAPLCKALEVPRASVYRAWAREQTPRAPAPRPAEQQQALDFLHDERSIETNAAYLLCGDSDCLFQCRRSCVKRNFLTHALTTSYNEFEVEYKRVQVVIISGV